MQLRRPGSFAASVSIPCSNSVTPERSAREVSNDGRVPTHSECDEAPALAESQASRDSRMRAPYATLSAHVKQARDSRHPKAPSPRKSSLLETVEVKRPSHETERLFREGSTVAVEDLFRFYYPRLCEFVARTFTDNIEDAEDVVQQAFLRAWRTREHLPPTVSIAACLFQLSREEALNALQSRRRRQRLIEQRDPIATASVSLPLDETVSHRMLLDRISQAIEAFPQRCRDVFYLRRFAGLSYSEIGDALGISVRTVEAHVCEGQRRLREIGRLR